MCKTARNLFLEDHGVFIDDDVVVRDEKVVFPKDEDV